ncbi:hypothetical protein LCGC14_1628420, partial [marine sediment metagenome]
ELRVRGEIQTLDTLGTAQAFRYYGRGAILKVHAVDDADHVLVITPTQIYDNGSVILSPVASKEFTGSYGSLGDHVYFGQKSNVGASSFNASSYNYSNNVFTADAGFEASYLADQGDKLWALAITGSGRINDLKWSDDSTNATPVFSASFSYHKARQLALDLAVIGPHGVVAVCDARDEKTALVAVDTSGQFTALLDRLPMPFQFTPFLGGQLLWMRGRPRALWLRGIGDYTEINVGGLDPGRFQGHAGTLLPHVIPTAGIGATSYGRELYYSLYGPFTKRDGSVVTGSVLMRAILTGEGLYSHALATPESFSGLVGAKVMAMRVSPIMTGTQGDNLSRARLLHFCTAAPEANTANSTVKLHRMDLWDGVVGPESFDTGIKFLRTSRYSTPSRTTGQMEVMRGYITKIPASNTVTVRVYLDGSGTETYNFSLNSAGPFSQALPTNVIGRDIAIDFETNANGSVIIEFPWSIDYFAVPDQKDIVRLPILAGRDQLTRAGTLQKKTRAEILDTLAGITAAPERWTLKWWDATPDWDVIPIDYQAADTEPDFVPGAGAAVAWLTLQRL